jgi:hypothetical protein
MQLRNHCFKVPTRLRTDSDESELLSSSSSLKKPKVPLIRRAKKKKISNHGNQRNVKQINQDLDPIEERMKHSVGSSNSEDSSQNSSSTDGAECRRHIVDLN